MMLLNGLTDVMPPEFGGNHSHTQSLNDKALCPQITFRMKIEH